ncbi:hypothetical protein IT575_07020 [bacterium]|nr:hypothetical protein [bacterium]
MHWLEFLSFLDPACCMIDGTVTLFLILGAAGAVGGYFLGAWIDAKLGTDYLRWICLAIGGVLGILLAYWIMRRNAESRDWS